MTQGIFIHGKRPASKKQIREQAATDPSAITIEATSFFGNDYEGSATGMPENKIVFFVGPDPATKRNFYGQISRTGDKVTVK